MTLAELRVLCEGATPGVWVTSDGIEVYAVTDSPQAEPVVWMGTTDGNDAGCVEPADAAFIAAARTWLPALIEVAEAAQRMNECVPGTSSFARHFVAARKAIARLDEVGR